MNEAGRETATEDADRLSAVIPATVSRGLPKVQLPGSLEVTGILPASEGASGKR